MITPEIHSCPELMQAIQQVGFLPLLDSGIRGYSAEDFVYPVDKHNREYGWGWSLLTTPEQLLGRDACRCDRSPQESFDRLLAHFKALLPDATERQILKLI